MPKRWSARAAISFPGLQFEAADAADLSLFADASFDAVVFSFNGIDYLAPNENDANVCENATRSQPWRSVHFLVPQSASF